MSRQIQLAYLMLQLLKIIRLEYLPSNGKKRIRMLFHYYGGCCQQEIMAFYPTYIADRSDANLLARLLQWTSVEVQAPLGQIQAVVDGFHAIRRNTVHGDAVLADLL